MTRTLSWTLAAATLILVTVAFALAGVLPGGDFPGIAIIFLLFLPVGFLITRHRPQNSIGWLYMTAALAAAISGAAYSYVSDRSLPAQAWAGWVASWTSPVSFGLVFLITPLVFPNGRLLSPRWRWVLYADVVGLGLASALLAFSPGKLDCCAIANPLGIEGAGPFTEMASLVIWPLLAILTLVGASSLVLRYRRSQGEERLQMKWFAFAISAGAAGITAVNLLGFFGISLDEKSFLGNLPFLVIVVGISAATGIAILRYRLYDIDVVINKALAYGALAAFITAAYLALVIGVGAVIGSRTILSIVATGAIAVAFQPIRQRVQAFANRLVYGQRVTPYEAMAELSHQMAGAISLDEVLPRLARTAADGVGAARGRVKVFLPDGEERAAWWPADEAVDLFDRRVPVTYQQEEIGEIAVAKATGDSLTTAEKKLLSNLASQAGLALRNVRLTEDLRASRRRIVNAQDEERKRMERDIHDGAQQQLVSLAVKLSLAENLFEKDPSKSVEMLRSLRTGVNDVVESVRDLARGIYPPLLSEAGVAAALKADVTKLGIDAEIKASDGNQRFEPQVEAAVYFCIREALQNASKHAAGTATVDLWVEDGAARFSVTDRGPGFDPTRTGRGSGLQNMIDRLEAMGGTLEIRSAPGEGTTVAGRVPASGFRSV